MAKHTSPPEPEDQDFPEKRLKRVSKSLEDAADELKQLVNQLKKDWGIEDNGTTPEPTT